MNAFLTFIASLSLRVVAELAARGAQKSEGTSPFPPGYTSSGPRPRAFPILKYAVLPVDPNASLISTGNGFVVATEYNIFSSAANILYFG